MYNRNAIDVWNICSYRVNSMVMDTPGAAGELGLCPYSLLLKYILIRSELHLVACGGS